MQASHSLGLITTSNFFVPQVNVPSSMATFVPPAAISAAIPVAPPKSARSGMGLITSSSFFVPQVNLPGSMASFVLPAGVPLPPPVVSSNTGQPAVSHIGTHPGMGQTTITDFFGQNYGGLIAVAVVLAVMFMAKK